MIRLLLAVTLALAGCRGGATTVRYAGSPVGTCTVGRGTPPPAVQESKP